MAVEFAIPWELEDWDRYVQDHAAGSLYHTSRWCRIVSETGRYKPVCLVARRNSVVTGILPAMEIRSRLTGNRLGTLPFSDECYPIADDGEAVQELVEAANRVRSERNLEFYEMRGTPTTKQHTGETSPECIDVLNDIGFSRQIHYLNYVLPLQPDTDALFRTFSRKSVRQTINKSFKMGVSVRHGSGADDIREFYRLYCITRRYHGIPPQPISLFKRIFADLDSEPRARLYLAEFEGRCIGAVIAIRFKATTYLKYEGVDYDCRNVQPVYAMFWKSIEESAREGDQSYELGRTAIDNKGLVGFKSRWGTTEVEMPYHIVPGGNTLSLVQSSSLKYRLFTGVFRRLPTALSVRIGERLFRHFG